MSLASLIALVSSADADPTAKPDHEEIVVSETVVSRALVPTKGGKVRHAKNEAAPIREKREPMVGMALPDRGSLQARDFLIAMRNAGKRLGENGTPFIDQREVRNDQIRAIHAFYYEVVKGQRVYVGYDPKRDFGSQEVAARMLAQREIKGAPVVSQQVAPSRTVGGYVAGMPQPSQRILSNLRAREQAAAEGMIDAKTDAERAAFKAQLAQVRAAIDELVG